MLELQIIVNKIKLPSITVNRTMKRTEKRISELEDKTVNIIQSKQ